MGDVVDDLTLRRLIFAKRLFMHGALHSDRNTELDRFLAIHHFDNAVELLLKIIATKEGIVSSTRKDPSFRDLWNELNSKLGAKSPPYSLPLKDQIFTLRDTRNLAQHQGDAPPHESVIKYEGYTKDFLVKCFKDIFDCDFEKVYASSLVNDEKLRAALIEAETSIESGNAEQSIKASAKAFGYLKIKEREHFSNSRLRSLTTFGVLDRYDSVRVGTIHSFERFEQNINEKINDAMQNLTDQLNKKFADRAEKINKFAEALEEELAILKLGVDYKEFKQFSSISPYVLFTGGGGLMIGDVQKENITIQNALFCHDFVLETTLRLQSLEANGSK
jgi:hypothetical protein